jgi:hypothetical protein
MFFPYEVWNLVKTFWITLPNDYYWASHEKIAKKYRDSKTPQDAPMYKFITPPVILPMVQIPDGDKPYFWGNSVVISTGNPFLADSLPHRPEVGTVCRHFATDIPIEYIQYIIVLRNNDVYSSTSRETFDCLYYIYNLPRKNKNGNNILPIYHSSRGIETNERFAQPALRAAHHKFTIKLLLSENCPKPYKFKFEQTVQIASLPQKSPFIFKEIACHPISMYLSDTISYFIMESTKNVHELLLDNEDKLLLYKEKQFGRYGIYPISNGLNDCLRQLNFNKIKKVKLLTHFYEKGIYAIKREAN